MSLLNSVELGDMTTAKSAATSLQSVVDAYTQSTSSSSSDATSASSTSNSAQSTFLAELQKLLGAVQSGDADSSKTDADSLIKDLQSWSGGISATG